VTEAEKQEAELQDYEARERVARRLAGDTLCDVRTCRRFVAGEGAMKPRVAAKLRDAFEAFTAEQKEGVDV
jgi:hypothetical protein